MKLISKFRKKLSVVHTGKKSDEKIFKKIQKKIASAFHIRKAEDEYDNYYNYIISFDSEKNDEIVAGYRYILCKNAVIDGIIKLNTYKYYEYSDAFMKEFFPFTIELGRSFSNGSPLALASLWICGLGPLITYHRKKSQILYILGQVTLQTKHYSSDAMKAIFSMFWKDFGDQGLLTPREETDFSVDELEKLANDMYHFTGNYNDDKAKLIDILQDLNVEKPTLFLSYADLVADNSGLHCALPVYNKLLKGYEMAFILEIPKVKPSKAAIYFSSEFEPDAFE